MEINKQNNLMGEKGRASIIGKHSNFFPHATPSLLGVQPCPCPPSTVTLPGMQRTKKRC